MYNQQPRDGYNSGAASKTGQTFVFAGKLYNSDFIKAGICKVGNEAMKDSLVLYRRRSCLLTNLQLLERELAKVKEAEERRLLPSEDDSLRASVREKEMKKCLLP